MVLVHEVSHNGSTVLQEEGRRDWRTTLVLHTNKEYLLVMTAINTLYSILAWKQSRYGTFAQSTLVVMETSLVPMHKYRRAATFDDLNYEHS